MNYSYKLTALFTLLLINLTFAQDKLKGNKQVIVEDRNISDFSYIEVIDDLEVELVFNEQQQVLVETDSNLQSAIFTEVQNDVLTLKTTERIGRKKELKIVLKVNKNLKQISAYNSAKIESKNSLIIDSLSVNAFDDSDIELKLISKQLKIEGKKSSNLEFEIVTDEILINLEENSDIKATVDAKEMATNLIDKSSVVIKGTVDNLDVFATGNSSFKGKDFITKNAIIKGNNSANLFIHSTETLELYCYNTSEISIYADPEITIHDFLDKAVIRKKEL